MIDSNRRSVLTTGAAAAAVTAAPQVFAQAQQATAPQILPAGAKIGLFEKGDVRIRYGEVGSGFPLLATPGGGLNSRMAVWPNAVINIPEEYKNDFRIITMDQRNAAGGESTGPVPVDNPWDAFADDQLALMDHLGIREFFYMGYCIGGCFAGKLLQRAPDRVLAAVFCQTVGHRPENPTVMYRHSKDNWEPDFLKRRPDVSPATLEQYFHNLYAVQPDFLYSVSRDFIKNCRTPILVLPDDVPGPVADL